MFNRWVEDGLLQTLKEEGIGCIAFSPLAQGLLTDKYLGGIPEGSRASKAHGFLKPAHITDEKIAKVQKLNTLAQQRGQTLAQMALAWVLRHEEMTSVLIGASKVSQIEDAVGMLNKVEFSSEELQEIENILRIDEWTIDHGRFFWNIL
jgi:L-glyceraldehyde 3-phosphate reductase